MKNRKKIVAIITSWLCAASVAAGTAVLPLSVSAFAADKEYTFDKQHRLDDVIYRDYASDDFDTDNDADVQDKLLEVFEKACRKDFDEITYGDLLKITTLNLSKMELEDIPLCLKYMTNLRSLDLSNNYLQNTENVSKLDLRALKKLDRLDLSYNYLTSVPSWYVLDSIGKKYIDHNFIGTENQRSIKAQTPVYYFMNGEEVDVNALKNRILEDIVLDNGNALPKFIYDPEYPAYDYGEDPHWNYPLKIEDFGLSDKLDENGCISASESYSYVTITVRLFDDKKNDNTKATIKVFLLDGSSPTTAKARLETLLSEVEGLDKTLYTARSWTNFETAQKTAQSIFDYPNSNADMLKAALEQLDAANRSLVLGIDANTKKVLTDLTAVGKTYKEENYTPDSWNSLQRAVEKITEIAADADATLSSAKSAILSFQNAQKGLEKTRLSAPDIIPKIDFEKIFGENKSVSAKGITRGGRSYEWRFTGTNLTAPADFNPETTDTPTGEDSILIESGRAGGYLAFSTEQAGEFPGKGILSINVSDKFVDGTYYLYKWGGSSGEFMSEVTVKNGAASIPVSEGGTYYISTVLQRYGLSSDKLTIDADKHTIIVPLQNSGYNAGSFKNLFKYGSGVTVYDADGKAVSSADRVKTGMSVSSPNGAEYVITVMGDVNDDGYVNAIDALSVLRYSVSAAASKPASTDKADKTNSSDKGKTTSSDKKTGEKEQVNGNPEAGQESEKAFGVGVTGINVADINGDGYTNAVDALLILKASVI